MPSAGGARRSIGTYHLESASRYHSNGVIVKALTVTGDGLENVDSFIDLEIGSRDISSSVQKRFPHLAGCTTFLLPNSADVEVSTSNV